jgi:gliding motility-associated-like protein
MFIILLITGFFSNIYGQGNNCNQGFTDYNWYFGNQGTGVQFSKNQSMSDFVPTATLNMGGTAVASDPSTGTVLFYTDGVEVYDVIDSQMANGGLTGNALGNQPVAICRNPSDQNQYYIFTNSANGAVAGAIEYTIIDMSLTGNAVFPKPALGAIDITNKNQTTGIVNASEAMIIVPNGNSDGFWLISHENGASNIIVMEINNAGPNLPATSISLGAITQAANISYHPLTNRLAVTSQVNGQDAEIYDFDPASGGLALNSNIANSGNSGPIYDIEWGYSGDILYVSREGNGGTPDLFQYDLTNPGLTSILVNPIDKSYGLQLAPDSSIYHLYQATSGGDFVLARISNIDSLTTNQFFGYQDNLFNGRNTGAQQFPAFLPPYQENYTLSFTPGTACLNSAVTFYPTLTNNGTGTNISIDEAFWDFTEGQSNNIIPTFTFQDVSTSSITLNARSGSCFYNITQALLLTDFQLQISMTSDTTFCREEFPAPRGTEGTASILADISGGTPTSINWFGPGGNTGQTSNTFVPDSAGYYYLVVSDATGCTAYQGVNVKEYGLVERRANIWYFGQNAGIDFNEAPPVALNDSQMSAPEGCSAISDRNGKIILYTDGVDVYDKEHTQLTTSDLGGNQGSTQSALIVPFTNDETRYYIFTTEEIYGTNTYQLKYSVFDLKLKNGLGDIVEKDILLLSPSTERITASTNWLIAHEYGNNTFRSYPITANGIGNPVYSNIGMDHPTVSSQAGEGYMKLGANDLVAVALSDGTDNYIELFDLDQNTGTLSNYRQIDLTSDGANGQVYGLEISPGGNKILASVNNPANSQIFEYYLDSLGDPQSLPGNRFDSGLDLGSIQIAPDGQIYVAINNSGTLGTITPNEDTTVVSNLDVSAAPFTLAGGTQSRLGLPNFIQSISSPALTPAMTVASACPGDPLDFTVSGTDTIDEFRWNILNSNGAVVLTSSIQNPSFTLNTPGIYTANVFIFNRCVDSPNLTLISDFEIYAAPTFTLIGTDVIGACGDDTGTYMIDVTSTASFSYTTNDGTGFNPDAANSSGINITGPISINIGAATVGNGLVAGAYVVTLTDDLHGCSDTQVVTISDPVPYNITATGLTDCDGINGILTVNFDASPFNNNITYSLTDEATNLIVSGHNNTATTVVANTFQITGLSQGTFTLQVTDVGCNTFVSGITVVPPIPYTLVIPADLTACDNTSVELVINSDAPNFQVTDPNNVDLGVFSSGFPFPFNNEGLYQITALDPNSTANPSNCPNTQPITITFNSPTDSPLESQYIICPDDPDPNVMTKTLSVGLQFISVRWFDDNNTLLQNGNGYTFAGDSIVVGVPGTIVAELTNPFGCVTMDTVSVVEDCQPRIVAPNAFRPSSSVGENQNFSIYSLFLKEDAFEIYIYNRWGELVFQSTDLNFEWNGGYGNSLSKPLPLGTYAYIVKYIDKNNEARGVQEQRGGVLLIK